jgi:hypothetical protein
VGGEGEESALWEEVNEFGFDGGAVKKCGRVGVLEELGVVILGWGVYFSGLVRFASGWLLGWTGWCCCLDDSRCFPYPGVGGDNSDGSE